MQAVLCPGKQESINALLCFRCEAVHHSVARNVGGFADIGMHASALDLQAYPRSLAALSRSVIEATRSTVRCPSQIDRTRDTSRERPNGG